LRFLDDGRTLAAIIDLHWRMQLHIARLCLDCNEVHDTDTCPVCSSAAFAYLSRWVPAPERRTRPRPTSSQEADLYRELIAPARPDRTSRRLLKGTAVGITIALVGWLWRRTRGGARDGTSPDATSRD
jgi:hypothetical protein